ncbi:hypothetical protein GLAREA_00353 [Glarea lozoyensis ATCC 20868]|uniref:Uncharacterized protein n=1 Tax=Glarea lozoyensis (strain ATCC 20868 / MF5171) TaxID=1116229 RepID=S3DRW6_GLAL2|nr:uncharacterized protein GLAREA_00353 [Glarea lozoyensis ATCC 20868]EPE29193.1 hypothetical protein GLAREA_00353 [Glarea lozoyensis ATCC 20868]
MEAVVTESAFKADVVNNWIRAELASSTGTEDHVSVWSRQRKEHTTICIEDEYYRSSLAERHAYGDERVRGRQRLLDSFSTIQADDNHAACMVVTSTHIIVKRNGHV